MLLISSKQDILIPFAKVGDTDWENRAGYILKSILNIWGAEDWETHLDRKTNEELCIIESSLNVKLPNALRQWYITFGIKDFKQGLKPTEMIVPLKEIWDTDEYPTSGEKLDVYERMIVFCNHLDTGTLLCYDDQTEEIYIFNAGKKLYQINKLANSADDFIKGILLYNQQELIAPGIEFADAEQWVKDAIEQEVGNNFYNQWSDLMKSL